MKIVFTGGGTGGHFYPLIAVAEELDQLAAETGMLPPEFHFFAPEPYSESTLFEHRIAFTQIPSGKLRRNAGLLAPSNIAGLLKALKGGFIALYKLFRLYPDVVFAKGAYGSFPTIFAARLLFIPVVIHESDSKPGRVNAWGGKFARYIAVSYPDAAKYFPAHKVAWVGQPLRREIIEPAKDGTREAFDLEEGIPTILVLGGSQGAVIINDALLDTLSFLLNDYQIIHQTGAGNFDSVKNQSEVTLEKHPHKHRYKPYPYLSEDMMKKAAGVASLVISRAGSTIFEIAVWGLPSIIIPIPERISHDQRTNAYNYMRAGACSVIEEQNLRPEIIQAEIHRILNHPDVVEEMKKNAGAFARRDAARVIAQALITIADEHKK